MPKSRTKGGELGLLLPNEEEVDLGAPGPKTERWSDYQRHRFEQAVREKVRREAEPTKLYEPLPVADRFHRSNARERILRGSNRSSKTQTACMELAWAATRRHPFYPYPDEGRAFVVGKNEKHISTVLYPKLFKTNPKFRMIPDEETGRWRNYRPWEDRERYKWSRPMPPLIPPRLIKGNIAWNNKALSIPSYVKLKTGWEIFFFPGGTTPPAGADIDYGWFDEEIYLREWYIEISARLLDRNGRFVWSCTAQEGGEQLWNLHCRAVEEAEKKEPHVEEYAMFLAENPYIDEQEKELLAEKYQHDPDAYRVRILGEYLITSFRVYPTFSPQIHCCDPFEIPSDWCRYMVVDPGHKVCAALFLAVPPPQDKDEDGKSFPHEHVYVYDELFLRDCDAATFAANARQKTQGIPFQAFLIDDRGSRRTEGGPGTTMRQEYEDALENEGVRCRATGSGFIPIETPNKGIVAGVEKVRKWLAPSKGCRCSDCWDRDQKQRRDGAPPFLRLFRGRTPNTILQTERYHKKRQRDYISDEPEQKNCDTPDCLRYAAVYDCPYVKPKLGPRNPIRRYLQEKQRRHRRKNLEQGIVLGAR